MKKLFACKKSILSKEKQTLFNKIIASLIKQKLSDSENDYSTTYLSLLNTILNITEDEVRLYKQYKKGRLTYKQKLLCEAEYKAGVSCLTELELSGLSIENLDKVAPLDFYENVTKYAGNIKGKTELRFIKDYRTLFEAGKIKPFFEFTQHKSHQSDSVVFEVIDLFSNKPRSSSKEKLANKFGLNSDDIVELITIFKLAAKDPSNILRCVNEFISKRKTINPVNKVVAPLYWHLIYMGLTRISFCEDSWNTHYLKRQFIRVFGDRYSKEYLDGNHSIKRLDAVYLLRESVSDLCDHKLSPKNKNGLLGSYLGFMLSDNSEINFNYAAFNSDRITKDISRLTSSVVTGRDSLLDNYSFSSEIEAFNLKHSVLFELVAKSLNDDGLKVLINIERLGEKAIINPAFAQELVSQEAIPVFSLLHKLNAFKVYIVYLQNISETIRHLCTKVINYPNHLNSNYEAVSARKRWIKIDGKPFMVDSVLKKISFNQTFLDAWFEIAGESDTLLRKIAAIAILDKSEETHSILQVYCSSNTPSDYKLEIDELFKSTSNNKKVTLYPVDIDAKLMDLVWLKYPEKFTVPADKNDLFLFPEDLNSYLEKFRANTDFMPFLSEWKTGLRGHA